MSLSSTMTQRVTIERPQTSDDGYGGKTISWVALSEVFAQVSPVLGAVSERLLAAQLESHAGYRVVMRVRSDVTAAMRIRWKQHVLWIHSLHEGDGTLNILCYEENV